MRQRATSFTPPIIEPELWHAVRVTVKARTDHHGAPPLSRHHALLRQRAICGLCKKPLYVVATKRLGKGKTKIELLYVCSGRLYDPDRSPIEVVRELCTAPKYPAAAVDAAAWAATAKALMDPDLLQKALKERESDKGGEWHAQVEGADKVLAQIRREEDQVLKLLREGIALDAVRARLQTLRRQTDNAENTKALAERAIADRAKAAEQAAGLEAQLRELRVLVKYADTFEKRDAILATLVPDDGKLATVHPDGRIQLVGLPQTSSVAGCPGRRSR